MSQGRKRKGTAVYGPASVEKMLGSLPVVAEFCRRLRIAEVVDELCPMRKVSTSTVTHGQVIELLVANRLTSPQPLVHLEEWAASWAVAEVFGVSAPALNDDRAGAALDALAEQLDAVTGAVGLGAISEFGLDMSQVHWDMTSMSLYGHYDQAEEGFATPKYGHPKDRRPDLKQVQTGLGVSADGAVPVLSRTFDGGASEVSKVVGAMKALQALAGVVRLLIIGDTKLVSYPNIAAMIGQKVTFIAPAAKVYTDAATLGAQRLDQASQVDYIAARDERRRPENRGRWYVREDESPYLMKGPRPRDPLLSLRRVFVYSTARAAGAASSRTKKLDRAGEDLNRMSSCLGSRHYPTEKAVTDRIAAISRQRKVGPYLRTSVGTDPDTGKPTLTWCFDQSAIDAEAATDGWYALLTNLDRDQVDAAELLRRYKGQEAVERRYHAFKGPLAVAPIFLKNNRRIAALVTVICLALLVFSLVERQVRHAVGPDQKIAGLYAGRPATPTGWLIFRALGELRLTPAATPDTWTIPRPSDLAVHLLELLGIDPNRPRYG